jgi:hypothetical protein
LKDWWTLESLKKTIPKKGLSQSFVIPKKNGTIRVVTDFRKIKLLLKHAMSHIFYSKDWGHDPLNGRVYLCFSIGL